MNVQNFSADQALHVVPRVTGADSRISQIYRGLLASLGAAFLLVSTPALAATAPPLGLVQQFGALGAAAVTAAGSATINGDVGSYPTPSITGFPPSSTTAPFIVHYSADAVVQQAQTDATAASVNLTGQGLGTPLGNALAGQTLTPGVYSINTPLLAGGTLTLNDPTGTGIFVFNVAVSLTTNIGSIVAGSANPCNIYWNIPAGAAILGANFWGTVISSAGVTLNPGVTLTGRAVATAGPVILSDGGAGNLIGGCSSLVTPAIVEPVGGQVGLSKAFFPSTIVAGGVSRIGITLMNNTGGAFTTTAPLTDTLPAGMVIAPFPAASTDCVGGLGVTAIPGASTVTLATGVTIPGAVAPIISSCLLTVNVTAPAAGSYTNNLLAGALTNGVLNSAATSAILSILAAAGAPTLSEWAMILLAALLSITGFVAMRRQAR